MRSLRHFESVGLLAPRRSEAGRRLYGRSEAEFLGRVLILKHAGYTLRQIADMTRSQRLNPSMLLDAQIDVLTTQQDRIALTLKKLRAARDLLVRGTILDARGLCNLIRQGQQVMEVKAWGQCSTDISPRATGNVGRSREKSSSLPTARAIRQTGGAI